MSTETKLAINFRAADKPPVMPGCRNCSHFTYDANERMGARGEYFEKSGKRCTLYKFSTTSKALCDGHEYRHADRRDV